MITPLLERFILREQATYKVHNHNISSFGILPVPKQNIVVITDITYYPHINVRNSGTDTYRDVMKFYGESSLQLESQSRRTHYNFKNMLDLTVLKPSTKASPLDELWGSDHVFIQPKPPIKLDTYLVHKENVNIRVFRNLPYKLGYSAPNGSMFEDVIEDNVNEPDYPRGMRGNAFNVVVEVLTGSNAAKDIPPGSLKGAMQYLPHTIELTNNATPAGKQAVQEYAQGIHLNMGGFKGSPYQAVDNQADGVEGMAFPLIIFGYVEISDLSALKELNEKFTFHTEQ